METKMIFEPLILRSCQTYTPGLKLHRFEFATELLDVGKSEDPTSRWRVKPSLKLDTLISRERQTYMPGLKLRRFPFAFERVGAGKSADPTSRWRVKQAAYQRSEKRAQAKGEEILLKIYSRAPSLKLDTLILREYQAYRPRLKLRRPLIFKDYLALKLGSKLYNFYKYRNRPGAPRENFAPGHICGKNALFCKSCRVKSPGLRSCRFEFATERVGAGKSEDQRHARLSLDPLIFRAYQAYTHRLKLRRPLIFEEYLALDRGDQPYNFYKSKYSRARDIRAARPASLKLDPLILRTRQTYTPGLRSRRLVFATELVEHKKSVYKKIFEMR